MAQMSGVVVLAFVQRVHLDMNHGSNLCQSIADVGLV